MNYEYVTNILRRKQQVLSQPFAASLCPLEFVNDRLLDIPSVPFDGAPSRGVGWVRKVPLCMCTNVARQVDYHPCRLSPDGTLIALTSEYDVRIFRVADGVELAIFDFQGLTKSSHRVCVEWSYDGLQLFASKSEGIVRIWRSSVDAPFQIDAMHSFPIEVRLSDVALRGLMMVV